jgi:Spy/CpxP family protein refolding chaperone
MKTNLIRRFALMSVMAMFLVGFSYAQDNTAPAPVPQNAEMGPHHQAGKGHHPFKRGEHAFLPNLTEQQQQQIKELRTKHQQAMLPLENQLNEKNARLKTLLSVQNQNNKDIDKVLADISEIQASILKEKVAHYQSIQVLLTPEQRVAFDSKPVPFLHEGGKHRPGAFHK